MRRFATLFAAAVMMFTAVPTPSSAKGPPEFAYARLKDIASITVARENQLIGYGLVVGLQGTGDSLRNSPFTDQAMRSMLDNLGIGVELGQNRSRNVAAVLVTANLPPFVRRGTRIDVTVSSLGDATDLSGGSLVMTSLLGADGYVYAVAQGPLIISGFEVQGAAERVSRGVPTSGRIPSGAIVERELPQEFQNEQDLTLQLRNPDFTTAISITDAVNHASKQLWGVEAASEVDARTVRLHKPAKVSPARFIAAIEQVSVYTDTSARVVIDERTGTIVIGEMVQISPVAVSHGALTVRVTEQPQIVQPNPFSDGVTAAEPNTLIGVSEEGGPVTIVNGVDLNAITSGLNRLGVSPQDTIAILQAIKSAGALQGELVLQ